MWARVLSCRWSGQPRYLCTKRKGRRLGKGAKSSDPGAVSWMDGALKVGSGLGEARPSWQRPSSPGLPPNLLCSPGQGVRGQVQMWASSSDSAGSGFSSNCPRFLLEGKKKKKHSSFSNGLANGFWKALQLPEGCAGWVRPGVSWCQEGALSETIPPHHAKAQKGIVT